MNQGVYAASNVHQATLSKTCQRYCRKERKTLTVKQPEMIWMYNHGMGGVDLLDAMTAVYAIPYRSKKWWWAFYSWFLTTSSVNAWRLRVQTTKRKEPYLEFLRELVIGMMSEHGCQPDKRHGRNIDIPSTRFDGSEHWIISTEGVRTNCKQCQLMGKKDRKTLFKCEKCGVGLHALCFKGRIRLIYLFL